MVFSPPSVRSGFCDTKAAEAALSKMAIASMANIASLAQVAALPLIDMMTAHDEIPMLRYRLRLHAPLAIKTIILESNLSHAGHPKPLHVRNALTEEEIKRYNIDLINVPFGLELERRMASCTNLSLIHISEPTRPY